MVGTPGGHRGRRVAAGIASALIAGLLAPATAQAAGASIQLASFSGTPTSVIVDGAEGIALEDLRTILLPPTEGSGATTINSAALGRIALGRIDLESSALGRIALGRIALGRIALGRIDVGARAADQLQLSQIPLIDGPWATWDEFLVGTEFEGAPLQTVTLLQLLESPNTTTQERLAQLDFSSLDLTGTVLDSLPLPSLLLAGVRLPDVPVAFDANGDPSFRTEEAWCTALTAVLEPRGLTCQDLGLLDDILDNEASLLSAVLAGVPLDDLLLTRIPLDQLPDSGIGVGTPLDDIPLTEGEVRSSALGRIALGRIDLEHSALGRIALGRIAIEGSALGRIALGRIALEDAALGRIALGRIALGRIDFDSAALGRIALGRIALGRIHLGQGSALDGVPLSSLAAAGTPVAGTPLGAISLTRSNVVGTPLGDIPLASVELAKVNPASSIVSLPLTGLDLTSFGGVTLGQLPSFGACDDPDPDDTPDIPSCSTPLSALLDGHTLGQLLQGLGAAGLGGVTLGDVIAGATPGTLGELLASLTVPAEPWGTSTLADLGVEIDELPGTLADLLRSPVAAALGITDLDDVLALIPDPETAFGASTLAQLVSGFNLDEPADLDDLLALVDEDYEVPVSLAELLDSVSGDIEGLELLADLLALIVPGADLGSLADLLRNLTGDTGLTLADLILFLLAPTEFDWESIALDADDIAAIKLGGERVRYTAKIDITCGDGDVCPTDHVLQVTLPAGFAFAGDVEGAGAPEIDGQVLRFVVPATHGGQVTIAFDANPVVGDDAEASARLLDPLDAPLGAPVTNQVDVAIGPDPAPGTPSGPRALAPDRMYLASLTSADDIHYWDVDITSPGQRLSVFLGNLAADYDLVVYGEEEVVQQLRGAPEARELSLDTNPVSLDPLSDAAGTEPREDLPLLDRPPYAIAAERPVGDAVSKEAIETGPLEVGSYLIQVSGYNGAFTDVPYTLRASIADPPGLGACGPRTWTLGSPLPAQDPVDNDDTTLFLVNGQRLDATFGAGSAQSVLTKIDAIDDMADGPEVGVLALDSIPEVNDAYSEWDDGDNRCEPQRANDVVRAIGAAIDDLDAPDLEHIVVVGADDIIPFSRVRDATTIANEQEYAQTFPGNSELASALARGYLLSDDPLADPHPVQSADRELFVPDVGIGRLVETPDDIGRALDDFVGRGGELEADDGFVSGYDFLTDGARAVAGALAHPGADTRDVEDELVGDMASGGTWTAEQLRHLLFRDPAQAADLASVNAHFDHNRLLPGLGSAEGTEDELVTITDVAANVEGSLLFSMGCHSGLSVAESAGGAGAGDWAETFIDRGALWVGNTGYGYGDTDVVALSEQLMTLFAQNLDGALSVGTALAQAKQQYLADLGVISPYDEKALMQTTLFGLPMYELDTPAPPAPEPQDPPDLTEVAPGLHEAIIDSPDYDLTPSSADESVPRYWSVGGQIQATQYRPIQPRVTVDVTPEDETLTARGALVTDLASRDEEAFPRIFRPVVANGVPEPIVLGDSAFPAAIQSVSSFETFRDDQGTRQQLVLIPGQYRSDGEAPGDPGTQRLYDSIDSVVYYGEDGVPLGAPATIEQADGAHVGVTAAFAVETDKPVSDILRVYVLYTAAGLAGEWQGLDLGFEDGHWTGNEPLPPTVLEEAELDYIVQIVTKDGQVSTTSNKGRFFAAPTPQQVGPILIKAGVPSTGGWFKAVPVPFTLEPPDGMTNIEYSVDGDAFQPYVDGFSVTGDGLHRVRARSAGDPDSESSLVVPIDTRAPNVVVAPPLIAPAKTRGWSGPVAPTVTFFREGDPGSISSGADRISYTATGAQPTTTTESTRAPSISTTVTREGITDFSYWSTDRAGNRNAEKSFEVKYDKTDPTITFTPPTFASNLRTSSTYGGATKPLGLYAPMAPPSQFGAPCSQSSAQPWPCKTYGDGKVPTYLLNSTKTVGYRCTDPVPSGVLDISGMYECVGPDTDDFDQGDHQASGEIALNTSSVGVKRVLITARDVAGNDYSEYFTYRVVYRIELTYDFAKASKSGTTSPIKVKLRDANGVNVSSSSITLTALEFRANGTEATFPGGANPGGTFQWVAKDQGYQFNAKPKISPNGIYSVAFQVTSTSQARDDGKPSTQSDRFFGPWTPYRAEFRIG